MRALSARRERAAAQDQLHRERRALSSETSQMGAQLTRAEERAALAEESAQIARAEARAETERLRRELGAAQQHQRDVAEQRAPPFLEPQRVPPVRAAWELPEWAHDHRRLSAEPFAAAYGIDADALAAANAERQPHLFEHAESRRRARAAHSFSVELLSFSEKVL